MYICEDCGKSYNDGEGILAEIQDNKIVMTSCSPFTILTQLCNECWEKISKEETKKE